jgi:Asp/Glu/hydantoin racemase
MADPVARIALIHATPLAIAPVTEAFRRLWPEAEARNLLDDALAPDLARAGRLDAAMVQRFRRLAAYVADCGADAILFTCSAFGPAIERAAWDQAPRPVLKPNEAMFAEALALGTRIGMVATFPPSLPPMEAEFAAMAAAAGSSAMLETVCTPGAMPALRDGDTETHDRLVVEAAAGLARCDVLLLAQFSMARARAAVQAKVGTPVLTSPDSAVTLLRSRLGAG